MELVFEGVSVAFGDRVVLDGLDLRLPKGDIACLLGASGCGKTTALRALMGFCTPKAGRIALGDRVFFDAKNQTPTPAHLRRVGMVFQDYALFPHLTVAQNVLFGVQKLDKKTQSARLDEALALVDLGDFADRYPHQLSGGQQQRVALARALAPKPDLLLLDEPFSNLDVGLRANLSLQVRQLLKSQNVGAVMVTHDQSEAFAMADVVGVMMQGKIQQWASPTDLYRRPKSEAIARFIGEGTFLEVLAYKDGVAKTAFGDMPYDPRSEARGADKVKLFLRPDDVRLDDPAFAPTDGVVIEARVCDYAFKGGHWLCKAQADKTPFLFQWTGDARPDVGAQVRLTAKKGVLVAA